MKTSSAASTRCSPATAAGPPAMLSTRASVAMQSRQLFEESTIIKYDCAITLRIDLVGPAPLEHSTTEAKEKSPNSIVQRIAVSGVGVARLRSLTLAAEARLGCLAGSQGTPALFSYSAGRSSPECDSPGLNCDTA